VDVIPDTHLSHAQLLTEQAPRHLHNEARFASGLESTRAANLESSSTSDPRHCTSHNGIAPSESDLNHIRYQRISETSIGRLRTSHDVRNSAPCLFLLTLHSRRSLFFQAPRHRLPPCSARRRLRCALSARTYKRRPSLDSHRDLSLVCLPSYHPSPPTWISAAIISSRLRLTRLLTMKRSRLRFPVLGLRSRRGLARAFSQ